VGSAGHEPPDGKRGSCGTIVVQVVVTGRWRYPEPPRYRWRIIGREHHAIHREGDVWVALCGATTKKPGRRERGHHHPMGFPRPRQPLGPAAASSRRCPTCQTKWFAEMDRLEAEAEARRLERRRR
jgi:hypothetical protein